MDLLADWIEVDDTRYDATESKREARRAVIEISVSPYDIPHQVRGEFSDDRNRLVIELRYLDDEPTKPVRLDHYAVGRVGKNSGRLYSIEVDVKAMDVNAVGLQVRVGQAIEDLVHAVKPKLARTKNYALVKRVVSDYWAPLATLLRAQSNSGIPLHAN